MKTLRSSLLLAAGLWLLWSALVAWAYLPGLNGPLLLDDVANLRPLDRIDLSEDFAIDVVLGNTSGLHGRPLSMASFALERLYFDRGPEGQKTVGLALHLLTGCLVLLLALRLYRAAGIERPIAPALAVAALWVSLPLLLSTTLYVVQRMTILSALFSFTALLAYCHGRDAMLRASRAWPWFLATALATLLAVLSKENGLLIVPLLTLVELFVYDFRSPQAQRDRRLTLVHGLAIGVPALVVISYVLIRPGFILDGYALRDFTFSERVLTETRILFDYVRQILWVDVHGLGLYHDDISLSGGLFSPASTAAAVAAWLLLAAGVVYSAVSGRLRLLAFGVAFFMVGHAMESTVFSLELYFEHRNYLPAFGVLFGAVSAALYLQRRWPVLQGWPALLLVLMLGRNLVLLGSQAVVWSDARLLHMDAANNHPDSQRAQLELARVFAQDGNLDAALALADANPGGKQQSEAEGLLLQAVYYCLSRTPFPDGHFEQVTPSREVLVQIPVNDFAYHVSRLVLADRCAEGSGVTFADAMWHWMVASNGPIGTQRLYGSLMLVENHLERYEQAMEYATLLTSRDAEDVMGWQFTLYLSHVLERPELGEKAAAKLRALQEAGRLTRQEASNLELFTAPPNQESKGE